ncbi:MAG: ABC transporter permease subunit [Acidobacteria bacterium]|jgi:osmoprotectant transport system permease protein|nr:ABC transporter permease subunit [Acidobacteriota bacterium]
MTEQLALLPGYLTAHLQLTLFALLIGTMVSIPVGVLITRSRWLEQPVLGVASVIQTIPSLALLALMVPALAALGFRSIGFLPAFIGLVLYSVLPILRNTVEGLNGVDEALVEAARGVGMTPRQRLRQIELPLAMPVILAGVRTSTVWTVGVATLSTPVGAPSLGNYIFSGLQTRNLSAVLVGCVAAAALALFLDGLVWALGAAVLRRRRGWTRAVLVVISVLYLFTGATLISDLRPAKAGQVVVGAKTFTEQYILSEILSGHIQTVTGAPTRIVSSLGSTVAFDALRADEIDVYVDYSGTVWATLMQRDTTGTNRDDILEGVRQFLREEHGIELVGSLGFENAYALAMPRVQAEAMGVTRISDLTASAATLTIGGDYEFFGRPEWKAIESAYQLKFDEQRMMDASLMYQAAGSGQVDVISAFSTDGRISAFDLVVLEDERGAIPPYDAVILAGPRLVRERPDVIATLRQLIGTIDADRMREMNRAVDQEGASIASVAAQFLRDIR